MRETLGYKKNHEEREVNDFYATPTDEVINILQHEPLRGTVLEPCCGMGHIVRGLNTNNKVIATDLVDRGFGEGGLDFLSDKYPYTNNIGTVIMNPPFKLIEDFVVKSLKIAEQKVLMFARLQFVESRDRFVSIFSVNPPTTIYQYVDRVACAKGGDFQRYMTSNMAFAWFVWDKHKNGETVFRWIRKYSASREKPQQTIFSMGVGE